MLERDKSKNLQMIAEVVVVLVALAVFSTVLAGSLTGASIFKQLKDPKVNIEEAETNVCTLVPFNSEISGNEICLGQGKKCAVVLDSKTELKNYPVHSTQEPDLIIGFTQSTIKNQEARDCESLASADKSEAVCCDNI